MLNRDSERKKHTAKQTPVRSQTNILSKNKRIWWRDTNCFQHSAVSRSRSVCMVLVVFRSGTAFFAYYLNLMRIIPGERKKNITAMLIPLHHPLCKFDWLLQYILQISFAQILYNLRRFHHHHHYHRLLARYFSFCFDAHIMDA